ncbi:MAG: hypothetical protein P4L63_02075 [Candidatus Pacebacteria bacterium]|nr:hypothetical protein [Candidatus Paceibacterota bacterium]
MAEKFSSKNPIENKRDALIKATAFFDAGDYIALMREKSPESLEREPDGTLLIDSSGRNEIFTKTIAKLNLVLEERKKYIEHLLEAVKNILAKESK